MNLAFQLANAPCRFSAFIHIKGPDFPTGAIIVGHEGIKQAYTTGRGKIDVENASGASIRIFWGNNILGNIDNIFIDSKLSDINISNINKSADINTYIGSIKIEEINLEKDSKINNSIGNIEVNKINYNEFKLDLKDS